MLSQWNFLVFLMKILKEYTQYRHPREFLGDKSTEKIIRGLAYEVICGLLDTIKYRKETKLEELRSNIMVKKQGLWWPFQK